MRVTLSMNLNIIGPDGGADTRARGAGNLREPAFHRLLIECGVNLAGVCHAVLLHVGENLVDGGLGRIE